MKRCIIVMILCICAIASYGYGVKGMRWGVRKASYTSSRYSSSSSTGHGINGCGVPNCHGSACSYKSSSDRTVSNQDIRTACTVVRTINNVISTNDRHQNAKLDQEYKKLRNEKLSRELTTGSTITRRVQVEHVTAKDSSYKNMALYADSTKQYIQCLYCRTSMSANSLKANDNKCIGCNETLTDIR